MTQRKSTNPESESVEPGMVVETTNGDLGEHDISKPKVSEVVRDRKGRVKKVVLTLRTG